MRITEEQVRKAVESRRALVHESATGTIYDREFKLSQDAQLIRRVRDEVLAMPEVREELVAYLKEQVEKGEYSPSAEEIVEAMIRRTAADRIR